MARCCSSVKPEVTKSCGAPASSMVAMAPKRAPVSDRALSTTSRSTVSRSRLALIRRLAALSAEMRSRRAAISRRSSSGTLTAAPRRGAESVCRGRERDRPGRGDSAKYRYNSLYPYSVDVIIHTHFTRVCVLLQAICVEAAMAPARDGGGFANLHPAGAGRCAAEP